MRILYHFLLSPFCRKVRVALVEKGLEFELKAEDLWQRRPEFLAMNPAGDVPVLVDPECGALVDATAISEYLEEAFPLPPLVPGDSIARAEVRRLVAWFDVKFNREVSENLVGEKLMKRFLRTGVPNSRAIRAGRQNIHAHLDYITWLVERRTWLGGDDFSLADVTAASHVSAVDYLGDVPWAEHTRSKDWYARVKSRPSFRAILADRIPGEPPPKHYADLDF